MSDREYLFAKHLVHSTKAYGVNMRRVKWFVVHLAVQKHGSFVKASAALQISRLSASNWAQAYNPTVEDLQLLERTKK